MCRYENNHPTTFVWCSLFIFLVLATVTSTTTDIKHCVKYCIVYNIRNFDWNWIKKKISARRARDRISSTSTFYTQNVSTFENSIDNNIETCMHDTVRADTYTPTQSIHYTDKERHRRKERERKVGKVRGQESDCSKWNTFGRVSMKSEHITKKTPKHRGSNEWVWCLCVSYIRIT